ncbi:GNAT family N-acetyltransferase [Hymenobacter gummosus]|uniref:GNAT family N-acetyltransferase n=1 Tax=Hymenobacter gummosus TaxID=1776032 RepID=A0A431U1G9_9BACT|nr:GNAT family N-acetyltransferase [Hymenobacter gummosus]RTQ48918.1 GNAT family N-acetyltransferase [Hymenobacter gummosus]
MLYREAQLSDLPELERVRFAVRENVLRTPDLVTPAHYEDYLTRRGRGWVATLPDGHTVTGFAIADLQGHSIWALFVDPAYDRQGIGKQLHRRMLDWYFGQTTETVWLSTAPGTRAEEFYRRQGWQDAGRTSSGEVRFEMTAEQWQHHYLEVIKTHTWPLPTNSIYELLDFVRRRPAMYTGRASCSHLNACIHGVRLSRPGPVDIYSAAPNEPDFNTFWDWTAWRLGFGDSVSGWVYMIEEQRKDPEEALLLFYQLLDEFRGLRPRTLAQVAYDPAWAASAPYYHFYRHRNKRRKPLPTTLTIEEVLPTRSYVQFYARRGEVILAAWSGDTVDQAQERAQQVLGVPLDSWQILEEF